MVDYPTYRVSPADRWRVLADATDADPAALAAYVNDDSGAMLLLSPAGSWWLYNGDGKFVDVLPPVPYVVRRANDLLDGIELGR